MKSKELRIVAPLHNNSGYASAGRSLIYAAVRAGYSVQVIEAEVKEVITMNTSGELLKHTVPANNKFTFSEEKGKLIKECRDRVISEDAPTIFLTNPTGILLWPEYNLGPRILYTMQESDTIPELWKIAAKNADLIFVPCRWNEESFEDAGLNVRLLPLAVDDSVFTIDGRTCLFEDNKHFNKDYFTFLTIFSICERKHWRLVLQAFAEEFRGAEVQLICKVSKSTHDLEQMIEWCRSMGANICVIEGDANEEQMSALHRTSDVYVTAGAEGFGMPCVEALMCGNPVIALEAGGTADIVNIINGYPVPAVMDQYVGQLPQYYKSQHCLPTTHCYKLAHAMRLAYDEYYDFPDIGSRRQEIIFQAVNRYGIDSYANELKYQLDREDFGVIESKCYKPVPHVVCIITTHNNLTITKRCVESIFNNSGSLYDFSIIIADDNSTDGTEEWCIKSSEFPRFHYVKCNTNGNVSTNRQIVTDYAIEWWKYDEVKPFVVYMDNDIEVDDNWFGKLFAVFCSDDKIGIVSPEKTLANYGGILQNVGNAMRADGTTFPLKLQRDIIYPHYVESACMVVRPEVWHNIKWDGQFPIFYEDSDYCFQARELGYDVVATSLVSVKHYAHTTSTARQDETERNRGRFLQKWRKVI